MIDDELYTLDEVLAMMVRVWDAVERSAFDHVAAEAIAQGFNETDVKLVIEQLACVLRDSRPARLETARLMLESGATHLQ